MPLCEKPRETIPVGVGFSRVASAYRRTGRGSADASAGSGAFPDGMRRRFLQFFGKDISDAEIKQIRAFRIPKGINMVRIITLTLNPAFDTHCSASDFRLYHENLAQITSFDVGGKGINISRALKANGIDSDAVAVIGRENGEQFRQALRKDGILLRAVEIPGRIRENLTIHTEHADETRISFAGFSADGTVLDAVSGLIAPYAEEPGTILALAGRVPEGIGMKALCGLLLSLREKGVRLVIDSKSFSLSDLVSVRPWLIKPNRDEVAVYLNREITSVREAAEGAAKLSEMGIGHVMVSLGGSGAVLADKEGMLSASVPSVAVRSTIGAGDSTIAGFLAGTIQNVSRAERLRTAVAFGTAACLTEGTRPPRPDDVRRLLDAITVKEQDAD